MSDKVDPMTIEAFVGVKRHATEHWGKAYSATDRMYVLHSEECRAAYDDLRECPYSLALDKAAAEGAMEGWVTFDEPTRLAIRNGYLVEDLTEEQRHE